MFYSHFRMLLLICLFAIGAGASLPVTHLDRLKDQGYLKVAVLKQPHAFYSSRAGLAGFDYDLAVAFADYLGMQIEVTEIDRRQDGITLLQQGSIDLLATGLVADASLYQDLGCQVTVVDIAKQILPSEDIEVSKYVKKQFEQHYMRQYNRQIRLY